MLIEVHMPVNSTPEEQEAVLKNHASLLGYRLKRSSTRLIGYEVKLVVGAAKTFSELVSESYLAVTCEIYQPSPKEDKPIDHNPKPLRMGG